MKAIRIISVLFIFIVYACTNTLQNEDIPILSISGGKVRGVLTDSSQVVVFKGIPYAAPPIGELRWKKPQEVIPWDTIMIADKFGNIAMQYDFEPGCFWGDEFYWMGKPKKSEDCLFLNVWAPRVAVGNANANLPVAVYIHGGAFQQGYGNEISMDGDAWAQRGVVMLTINYRVGIEGFLSHPLLSSESEDGTSGNYGIYDQLAALQWVKKNIAQFGGNPNDITVFGQSAGARSVKFLVSSPLAKGLVSKAIILSGGGISTSAESFIPTDVLEKEGRDMLDLYGLKTLDQMRKATSKELKRAGEKYDRVIGNHTLRPHLDGVLITEDFTTAVNNNHIADIPYMIGYTADDNASFKQGDIERFAATRNTLSKQPTYCYLFARPLPGDNAGAFHTGELWYVFHTLQRSWRPFISADYELSDRIVDYFTNFVKYGNPSPDNRLDQWMPYTKDNPHVQVLQIK
ncbi:MAG: carboxylesterase family protein [Phocaeicola sp.]|nr:carboxylesterase family protein [Phocaeicola sp.]